MSPITYLVPLKLPHTILIIDVYLQFGVNQVLNRKLTLISMGPSVVCRNNAWHTVSTQHAIFEWTLSPEYATSQYSFFHSLPQNSGTSRRMILSTSHVWWPRAGVRQQCPPQNISLLCPLHASIVLLMTVVRNMQRWDRSLDRSHSCATQPSLYLFHFLLKNRKGLQGWR